MFTGLVEELGTIKTIYPGPSSSRLNINAKVVLEDVKLGDSIAVNGVCLTVTQFTKDSFQAQVMEETLKKTNLKELTTGSKVNLERAMRMGDRLGGHMVSGHVDGMGKIIEQAKVDIALITRVETTADIINYLIPKGSIAIDGISLTIVEVNEKDFTISLIPHTMSMTTLGFKKIGDKVNLEIDMIAKYVERFFVTKSTSPKKSGLTMESLLENGFL